MNRLLPTRNTPIDYLMALRGAAVIGVLLGHLLGNGNWSLGAIASNSTGSWSRHSGYLGFWRAALEIATPIVGANFVILFFVLSGYLMGKVFFEGRYDAIGGKRAFYWARFLRLAPLLYFNLLVCIALVPFADLSPVMMAGDFLFINNITGRGINLVTWSLSYEMQYYLIAPFVFLLFRRKGRYAFPAALALALVAFVFGGPLQFTCSFLAGFSINLVRLPKISLGQKHLAFGVGLVVLHLAYNALFFFYFDWESGLLAIVASAFLVAVCEMPVSEAQTASPLVLRLAVLTGYLTYGIYLWHYVIIRTQAPRIENWIGNTHLADWQKVIVFHSVGLVVVLTLSFALSYITFETIEKRFRPKLYAKA